MAPRRTPWARPCTTALAALLCCLPLAAPAATAPVRDPFEKLNRATYAFNNALDRMLARPAARAYKKVVPEFVQHSISNFVVNIAYTSVIFNDALQGKVRQTGSDAARFAVNTTVGLGGFFDVATHMGLMRHEEDFGQTLGHWGVPAGPYLVIPILGPSDFRDAPAKVVDVYTQPMHYFGKTTLEKYGLYALDLLDTRVRLLPTDETIANTYDPYVFVRNAYLARRNYLVHDGNVPEEDLDDPTGDIGPTGDNGPIGSLGTPSATTAATMPLGLPGVESTEDVAAPPATAPAVAPGAP
jgi:phospholipid-binding lipoprotein MlaA